MAGENGSQTTALRPQEPPPLFLPFQNQLFQPCRCRARSLAVWIVFHPWGLGGKEERQGSWLSAWCSAFPSTPPPEAPQGPSQLKQTQKPDPVLTEKAQMLGRSSSWAFWTHVR